MQQLQISDMFYINGHTPPAIYIEFSDSYPAPTIREVQSRYFVVSWRLDTQFTSLTAMSNLFTNNHSMEFTHIQSFPGISISDAITYLFNNIN
jgi:hypothetical protein